MTPERLQLAIVSANTVTLIVGGSVTLIALRAHRRTGSRSLRALAVGLGSITLGTLLGGLLHQSGVAPLLLGVTVQSVSVAAGFVLLGWSLLGDGDNDGDVEQRFPSP